LHIELTVHLTQVSSIITPRLALEFITEEINVTISVCMACLVPFSQLALQQIASNLVFLNPKSLSDEESIQSMQKNGR
jgi:hypothetical protein